MLNNDGDRATLLLDDGTDTTAVRGIGQTREEFLRNYPVGSTVCDVGLDPDDEDEQDGAEK